MICYTDGSAHPNPGPGGFGVVVLIDENRLDYTYSNQFDGPVTNNEMEMEAILYCMIKFGKRKDTVVYTDSSYALNTFTNWMFNWQKNKWTKSNGKEPENLEIVKSYYEFYRLGYRIDLKKVKGHTGNEWNEMADQLATGILEPTVKN